MILPELLRHHGLARGLTKQKRASQVGGENFVPLLQRHIFHRSPPRYARVVDQNVDAAELRQRRVHDFLNRSLVFDIACQKQAPARRTAQRFRRFLAAFLLAGAEYEVRTHFRQALGHLPAQSHRAAGNNGHASGQVEKLFDIHFVVHFIVHSNVHSESGLSAMRCPQK